MSLVGERGQAFRDISRAKFYHTSFRIPNFQV